MNINEIIKEYKEIRNLNQEQVKDIEKDGELTAYLNLKLRKELVRIMSLEEIQKIKDSKAFDRVNWYLNPEYANLEHEHNNNGLCNLIEKLEELWDETSSKDVEKLLKGINEKHYGDWNYESDYGDCLGCGEFGELNNGWGQNEGYHFGCQPEEENEEA